MKTNILGLALLVALTSATSLGSSLVLGDEVSFEFSGDRLDMEERPLLFAPGEPALMVGSKGGEYGWSELRVNATAAIDFVEIDPHTLEVGLLDPADEFVPGTAVYDFTADRSMTRDVPARGLMVVPEPAITFLAAFAGILLLLTRRRKHF